MQHEAHQKMSGASNAPGSRRRTACPGELVQSNELDEADRATASPSLAPRQP